MPRGINVSAATDDANYAVRDVMMPRRFSYIAIHPVAATVHDVTFSVYDVTPL